MRIEGWWLCCCHCCSGAGWCCCCWCRRACAEARLLFGTPAHTKAIASVQLVCQMGCGRCRRHPKTACMPHAGQPECLTLWNCTGNTQQTAHALHCTGSEHAPCHVACSSFCQHISFVKSVACMLMFMPAAAGALLHPYMLASSRWAQIGLFECTLHTHLAAIPGVMAPGASQQVFLLLWSLLAVIAYTAVATAAGAGVGSDAATAAAGAGLWCMLNICCCMTVNGSS